MVRLTFATGSQETPELFLLSPLSASTSLKVGPTQKIVKMTHAIKGSTTALCELAFSTDLNSVSDASVSSKLRTEGSIGYCVYVHRSPAHSSMNL